MSTSVLDLLDDRLGTQVVNLRRIISKLLQDLRIRAQELVDAVVGNFHQIRTSVVCCDKYGGGRVIGIFFPLYVTAGATTLILPARGC